MNCKSCGYAVTDTALFCSNCGAKIERELKCSSCGAVISPQARFCEQCGAQTRKSPPGAPPAQAPAEAAKSIDGEMLAVGGYLYFVKSEYGTPNTLMRVHCTNPGDAAVLYKPERFDAYIGNLQYYGGKVYFTSNGHLACFDTSTMQAAMLGGKAADFGESAVISSDGTLYEMSGSTVNWLALGDGKAGSFALEPCYFEFEGCEQALDEGIHVYNGYGYVSVNGAVFLSARFPLSNPRAIEKLPDGVCIPRGSQEYMPVVFWDNKLLATQYKDLSRLGDNCIAVIELDTLQVVKQIDGAGVCGVYRNLIHFTKSGSEGLFDLSSLKQYNLSDSFKYLSGSTCTTADFTYQLDSNQIRRMDNRELFKRHEGEYDFDQSDLPVYYQCPADAPFVPIARSADEDNTVYSIENNTKTRAKCPKKSFFYGDNYIVLPDGTQVGFAYGHTDEYSDCKNFYYNLYKIENGRSIFLGGGSRGGIHSLIVHGDAAFWCDQSAYCCMLDGSGFTALDRARFDEIRSEAENYTDT